ncbi:MAG: Brp/Blh family beta-carotene 15,15'-dioxygenase [Bacteroidota bacterium]
MNKLKFNIALVVLTFLCLTIYPWFQAISYTLQLAIAGVLVFLVGIPHGAIDHVIYFKAKKRSLSNIVLFYAAYIGLMLLYALVWVWFPYFSLLLFLIISAVHFGQSQFSFLEKNGSNLFRWIFYLAWGGSLLLGLTFYHYEAILSDFINTAYFTDLELYLPVDMLLIFFWAFTISAAFLIIFYLGGHKDYKASIIELVNFALIHFILFCLPPLLGFTIYFVFWHSLKVLFQEYDYLKLRIKKLNFERFLKILTPHSLISIVGALLMIATFNYLDLDISPVLLVLIFLSVLTLPHTIVMNRLYE